MLLRIARRNSTFSEATPEDAEQIMKTEFKKRGGDFDLSPSIYEFSNGEDKTLVVQAHAEHAANADCGPVTRNSSVDVAGCHDCQIEDMPTGRFSFIRSAHRELKFSTKDELLEFTKKIIREVNQQREIRLKPVKKNDVVCYAREKIKAEDKEWLNFFCEKTNMQKKWSVRKTISELREKSAPQSKP